MEIALHEVVRGLKSNDPRVVALSQADTDGAVSVFLSRILADDGIDRMVAMRALWLVPLFSTPELLRAVVDVIRRRPDVAQSAGHELSKVSHDSLYDELSEIVLDAGAPAESRLGATVALSTVDDSRVTPLLLDALVLARAIPSLESSLALTIGYLQLRQGRTDAASAISVLLKSPSPDVRVAGIKALGNMWAREAADMIEALVNDTGIATSGESVRATAMQGVALLRGG